AIPTISAGLTFSSAFALPRPSERKKDRLESAVERPEVRKSGPRICLARAHSGTAVEESNTPVYEATNRPKKLPIVSSNFTGKALIKRESKGNQFNRPSMAAW